MKHKVGEWKSEHGSGRGGSCSSGTVTLITECNVTYIKGRGEVTLRSEPTQSAVAVPQIIWQQVVEASPRSLEPLDANVGRAPLLLEVGLQQFGHRFHEIQRTIIPKVQAGPTLRHAGIVA